MVLNRLVSPSAFSIPLYLRPNSTEESSPKLTDPVWFAFMHHKIHVAYEREPDYPTPWPISSKHACFSLPSGEALLELQTRIYEHKVKGGKAAAIKCDQPGKVNSGIQVGFRSFRVFIIGLFSSWTWSMLCCGAG